ncbi:hypothetical protein ABZX85_15985 [Streptomyces sp. NPDC004539]|uniref:hypothetical protein n=1 Tax=Streptomyces sp. NPDC004539 TaxID=3154280 RepID=UPI0033B4EBB7
MRPLSAPPRLASAASGARAGFLTVLCVLLPLLCHTLAQGHAPRWVVVAALAVVAVPGALSLTRERLTETQLVGVLAAAQVAYHSAYSLPGVCASVSAPGGPASLVGHDAVVGPPHGVALAGQLVTLVLAARLLGLTERLLWRSRPLLTVVRRLLLFVWPLLGRVHGTGPEVRVVESAVPLRPAVLDRLREGRAPPRRAYGPCVLLRPTPMPFS